MRGEKREERCAYDILAKYLMRKTCKEDVDCTDW
jgi:hypothetical protein